MSERVLMVFSGVRVGYIWPLIRFKNKSAKRVSTAYEVEVRSN